MDKKNFFIYPDNHHDMAKRWFVYHYQIDVATAKKKRVKHYGNINKFKTADERLQAANHLINVLCGVSGTQLFRWFDLVAALRNAIEQRKHWIEPKQFTTYHYRVTVYERYLKFADCSDMHGFVSYLKQYYSLSNTTCNHYIESLNTLFKMLQSKKIVNVNPCDGVQKLKERRKHGNFFNVDEKELLKVGMQSYFPELILPAKWIFNCLIRPKELRALRVANIDWFNKTVTINADVAKSDVQRIVNIPGDFFDELIAMNFHQVSPSFYLVSRSGFPGDVQVGKNYFYKRQRKLLDMFNFERGNGYYFYSWKHTGLVNAALNGVSLLELKEHAGHKYLQTTQQYMERMLPKDLTGIKSNYAKF